MKKELSMGDPVSILLIREKRCVGGIEQVQSALIFVVRCRSYREVLTGLRRVG
jgi:hypothetical protein